MHVSSIITRQQRTTPLSVIALFPPIRIDELCNSMRIGRLYRVLGIPAHVHQWPNITWSVEANNVQPWEPDRKAVNYLIWNPCHRHTENKYVSWHTLINLNKQPLCIVTILKYLTILPTDPHKVSARFQELLKTTASSPWRFPAIVAHSFGSDMAPPGLYNTLKLGLLLSLVQTRAGAKDTFHNLDLLVVTTDTLILDR